MPDLAPAIRDDREVCPRDGTNLYGRELQEFARPALQSIEASLDADATKVTVTDS